MKKLLSLVLSVALLCTSTVFVSADAAKTAETSGNKIVKVGINAEYIPFEYYENEELTGFDVDLMNNIATQTGYTVEYVDMSFEDLVTAVANGEVDCAISAITATEERDEIVDYSRKYLMCNIYAIGDDGATEYQGKEEYAIVFREGAAKSKYFSRESTEYEILYMAVDDALIKLAKEGTIDKLIQKYELDKPIGYDGNMVQFMAVKDYDNNENAVDKISSDANTTASDWAKESVQKAIEIGLINDTCIFPSYITREEFCDLIYNYCSMVGELAVDDGHSTFKDTDNVKIRILNSMGIIYGKSSTEFAPNDLLTREEAATIILRLIKTVHPQWPATEQYILFNDESDISDWAMNGIQVICNMGIMNGVGEGNFAPKNNFTIEQAVATVERIYERNGIIGGGDEKTDIVISDSSFEDKLNAQMPDDKNYMFSPISVKMALALAANGAEGKTKEELLNAMNVENIDNFNKQSKDLIERYSQADILNLNVANSIWMNNDKTSQKFSNSFKKTASSFYNADVESVNNKNAVSEVNSWVKEKTNGKIPQIIKNSDDFTAMLVNAIYFKGAWKNEFNKSATKLDEFTSADGTKKQIDFMNRTAWMSYAETKSTKIVELPYLNMLEEFDENDEYIDCKYYDDLDVSMYVIAADSDINVAEELEAAIADNSFESSYVKLSLPKFKIEYSESMKGMLQNIGIKSAFEPDNAQFGKMFDSGNMWITDTIHKTFIDVDEKGTEAAAVTAVAMAGTSLPPEPTELKFNKPFYFAIRDNTSGMILFMGRYAYAE